MAAYAINCQKRQKSAQIYLLGWIEKGLLHLRNKSFLPVKLLTCCDREVQLLADCGLNLSDAIRLFLRQVVVNNGLPFEVKIPNATNRATMDEARSNNLPRYHSAYELFDGLEKAAKRKAC